MTVTNKRQPHWIALVGWLALTLAAGSAGAVASANAQTFYAQLIQPPWAPPASVFGPVWTTLYVLMAIAAWMVWREREAAVATPRRYGLIMFVAQLALNGLWTWLFFRWRAGAAAFIEIVVLWAAIAFVIRCFMRVRPIAGWLMVPYLAWVTFAAALTWSVWRANPGLL